MVTRIDKSSKTRNQKTYLLLWRLAQELGWPVINLAIDGNEQAIKVIEDFAWSGRKRPALVCWINKQRKSARATEVLKSSKKGKARC
jgi:hypothetical protein